MELQTFNVTTRKESGKGPARQQRMKGRVPGVLYGGGQDPVSVSLDARNFEFMLQAHTGAHAVLQLVVEDNPALSSPALVKGIQRHPVKDSLMHADFMRISLDKRIHTSVPVEVKGQPKGVIDGGVLEHPLREVEIECLALDVPERIIVDVTAMKIGESIHVSDLVVADNITLVTDATRPVVSVHAPRVVKTVEAVEAVEAAEEGAEEPKSEASPTRP